MNGLLIFLQLSSEFGGTRFGPFQGPEIRLGSDAAANDITLPEALGVLPQHVKILIQSDGSFIVAPTERTASVYVYRGSSRAKLIATATALAPNDSFALVTAEGPRFILVSERPQQEKKPKRPKKPDMIPTKAGLWAEIKRVGFVQVFRTGIGNSLMYAWTMVKSGTIFTPRFIIGFLMLSTGWMAAVMAGLAAFGSMFALSNTSSQLQEVQGDLAECQTFSVEDSDVYTLTQAILGDDEWAQSLRNDDEFHQSYLSAIRSISDNRQDYTWVFTSTSSDFTTLKRAAERDAGLGKPLGRVFSYAAATPGEQPIRDWFLWRETAPGDRGCGRGPARMTYIQARNLGLTAMPDILESTTGTQAMSQDELRDAILGAPGLTPSDAEAFRAASDEITAVPVGPQGSLSCLHLEGQDDRADARDLVGSLAGSIGPDARGMPGEGANYWITSRLIRYYAAGLDLGFETLSFDGNPPTPKLDAFTSSEKEFIVSNAATLVARSTTIPCMAALDSNNADRAEEVLGELPNPLACLQFLWLATEQ